MTIYKLNKTQILELGEIYKISESVENIVFLSVVYGTSIFIEYIQNGVLIVRTIEP